MVDASVSNTKLVPKVSRTARAWSSVVRWISESFSWGAENQRQSFSLQILKSQDQFTNILLTGIGQYRINFLKYYEKPAKALKDLY